MSLLLLLRTYVHVGNAEGASGLATRAEGASRSTVAEGSSTTLNRAE